MAAARARAAAGAAALLVVAIAALLLLPDLTGDAGAPGGDPGALGQHAGVVAIEASGTVGPLAPVEGANALAVSRDAVWVGVTDNGVHALVRIDPASHEIDSTIRLAPIVAAAPGGIAVGEGAVWAIVGDRVYRVEPSTGDVDRVRRFARRSHLSGIAAGQGAVWVADATRHAVHRIDPRTGRVSTARVEGAAGVTAEAGAVWVTSSRGSVVRLDATSGRVVGRFTVPGAMYRVAAGAGGVWVLDTRDDSVVRLDPASGEMERIRVGRSPTSVAVGSGRVWVVNSRDGTVSVIEPRRGAVAAEIEVGTRPYLVAASGGTAWVVRLGRPHEHEEDEEEHAGAPSATDGRRRGTGRGRGASGRMTEETSNERTSATPRR